MSSPLQKEVILIIDKISEKLDNDDQLNFLSEY